MRCCAPGAFPESCIMRSLRFLSAVRHPGARGGRLFVRQNRLFPPCIVAQIPEVGVITVTAQVVPYTFHLRGADREFQAGGDCRAGRRFPTDRIAYAEGDFVKEGQTLFQIDPKPFKAQLEAAQGELGAQKARLATAKANLARVKPLAGEQNALSQADLDRATGDFEAAARPASSASAKVRGRN